MFSSYLEYPAPVDFNSLKWVKGEWEAPDGKRIPFEKADITDMVVYPNYDRWQDDGFITVEITRWPRKVTITASVHSGVDDYTGDGDGCGQIFNVLFTHHVKLITTDRFDLEKNSDQHIYKIRELIDVVEEKYRDWL